MNRHRKLSLEKLESRELLAGVTVTTDSIVTPHDVVPRFGASPTIMAVNDGLWSDAETWNLARAPSAGDVVRIPGGKSVVYDVDSIAQLDVVEVGGALQFATDVDTKLWLNELVVLPAGELVIGTSANPIESSVTAEVVFTDTPDSVGLHYKTGSVEQPGLDPEQWGNGLLVFGDISIHGAPLGASFQQVTKSIGAGDTSIELVAPTGWKSGDVLLVPDTSSSPLWRNSRIETVEIDTIQSDHVELTTSIAVDHAGALAGDVELLPHVGNLSRNVMLRSENPDGVRGHVAFFGAADVDVRYARFHELGRTRNGGIDETVLSESGDPTHIGTNQAGRYSMHLHHVKGPENLNNQGYQYEIVGNAVDGAEKWAIVIHNTHFGRIEDNFVYDVVGGGIVAEDGNESFNLVQSNFVVHSHGDGPFKQGRAGEAFWFRGPMNSIVGNVAANSNRAGFDIFVQNLPPRRIPNFRGANVADPNQSRVVDVSAMPLLDFSDNTVYASDAALDVWTLMPETTNYVNSLTGWHTADNNFSVSSYQMNNAFFDDLLLVGDVTNADPAAPQWHQPFTATGIEAVRSARDLTIDGAQILGAQKGIVTPRFQVGEMRISNATIRAYKGVVVNRMTDGGTGLGSRGLPYSSLTIENTRFERMPENLVDAEQYSVYLDFSTEFREDTDLTAVNEVFLIDFNGEKGANYQVYFPQQAPDFVMPVSVLNEADPRRDFIASPVEGLTNAEAWEEFGVAIGGRVAPCMEFDGDSCEAAWARAEALGIHGLVFPIDVADVPPTVEITGDVSVTQFETLSLTTAGAEGSELAWSKVSGPGEVGFVASTPESIDAVFSEPGDYRVRVAASVASRTAYDDIAIHVLAKDGPFNQPPTVNAGEDQVLEIGNVADLAAVVGDDGASPVSISWTVVDGPGAVEFDSPSSPVTKATFANMGTYQLRITASDGDSTVSDDVTIDVANIVPSSPLLAHWDFEEVLESSVQDDSVHDLDAQLVDGATPSAGRFGQGVALNGGFIAAPANSLLMPVDGLTVALWVRQTGELGTFPAPIFSWDGGIWRKSYAVSIADVKGGLQIGTQAQTSDVDRVRAKANVPGVPIGEWMHISLTFEGGNLTVYHNGVEAIQLSGLGNQLAYTAGGSGRLTFGRRDSFRENWGDVRFPGEIDDIYIFNYALTSAEISGIMADQLPLGLGDAIPTGKPVVPEVEFAAAAKASGTPVTAGATALPPLDPAQRKEWDTLPLQSNPLGEFDVDDAGP